MVVRDIGCTGFSNVGWVSARPSSPSSSLARVLFAGGPLSSWAKSLLRAISGARASTELERTPRGKNLKGGAANPGWGRDGDAGREDEEWMAAVGKRAWGRVNWEGGVWGSANLASTSRNAKSEAIRG